MRKKGIRIMFFVLSIAILFSLTESDRVDAMSSPEPPILYFYGLDEMEGYIRGEKKLDEDADSLYSFENYKALVQMKKKNMIPVPVKKKIVSEEGMEDYKVEITEIEVRDKSLGDYGEMKYYLSAKEQTIKVTVLFLEGEALEREGGLYEFKDIPNIGAEMWRIDKGSWKHIDLYDRKVYGFKYDKREYYIDFYKTAFVYDSFLVFIEGPADLLTESFLSHFAIEDMEIDYQIKHGTKFLRGYRENVFYSECKEIRFFNVDWR